MIIQSNHQPIPTVPTNHGPQCHICPFPVHLQGQWLHHLPGQPVPMPHHSYWEEIFPNTGNLTTPPLFDVLQQSRDAGCGPMLGQGQMQTPLPMRSDMETESSFKKFCSCLNQLWGSIWWHWKSLPTFWMLMFKKGFAGFRSYCKQLFHRWSISVAALQKSAHIVF